MAAPVQAPAAPAEVPVLSPDGELGTVPAANAQAAASAGYRLISDPAELAQLQAQAKYGGAGGAALAGLAGVGRGLTFGASDLALTESGAVAPETLKGLKEANPIASGAGLVAGAALPVLASGGEAAPLEAAQGAEAAGALARAGGGARSFLEAVGALPRAAAGAGEAVGSAVSRAAGEGLAGRLAASGARGAVEGGLYGAGDALSESALENKPLTAESLVASVGPSALFGGALGAGFEGALGLARTAAPKALEGASDRLERLATRAEEASATSRVEKFASALDGLNEVGSGVVKDAAAVRDSLIAHELAGSSGAAEAAAATVAKLRSAADALEDSGTAGAQARKVLARVEEALPKAADDAERFSLLNQAKREIDSAIPYERNITSPLEAQRVAQVRQLAGGLRSFLEDTGTWGKAGEIQAGFNARLSDLATDAKAFGSKTMRKALGVDEAEEATHGKVADALKAERILRDEASEGTRAQLRAGQTAQTLRGYTQRLQGLADFAREAAGDLPVGQVRDVGGFLKAFEESKAAGVKAFAPSPLEHVEHFLPHGIRGPLGAVAKLSRQTEVVAAVARKAADVTRQASGLIKDGLAGRAAKATSAAPGILSRVSWGSSTHPGETRQEAIARHLADHAGLGADPATTAQRLADATPNLGRHAPGVASAVQQTAVRAQQYLAQAAPKSPVPPSGLPGEQPYRPSAPELARFEHITRAVERPLSLLEDFRAGQVRPEAVAAVRSVYPELYQQMRSEVARQMGALRSPLPQRVQLQLSTLLGAPVTPAQRLQGQLQAVMAAAIARPSEQPPGANASASLHAADRAGTNLSRSTP